MGRGAGGTASSAGTAGRQGRSASSSQQVNTKPLGPDTKLSDLPIPYDALPHEIGQAPSNMIFTYQFVNAVLGGYATPQQRMLWDKEPLIKQTAENMQRLLDKLPPTPGETYNVKRFKTAAQAKAFMAQFTEGQTFTNSVFLYTHREKVNNYGFHEDHGPTQIRTYIKGKKGKDIGPYYGSSQAGITPEARLDWVKKGKRFYTMFGPNQHRFRVTKITQTKKGTYEMYWEEI